MTHSEALNDLAEAYGLSPSYIDNSGTTVTATAGTLVTLLRAMGVDLGDAPEPAAEDIRAAHQTVREELAARPLPLTVAAVQGDAKTFPVHVHDGDPAEVSILCEDGTRRAAEQEENWATPVTVDGVTWGEATFRLPTDLPTGYHTLVLESGGRQATTRLIVSPARLSTADTYLADRRFGVMAQLYSVRSASSWGIGDFHDLGLLAETLATEIGADFLLVNPLHAAEPLPPVEDSPYLPTTRRFTNPIYLRVEDVPEYRQVSEEVRTAIEEAAQEFRALNRSTAVLERDPIYGAKLDALRELHAVPPTPARRQAYDSYRETEGQGLVDFATWCAHREIEQSTTGKRHAAAPDLAVLVDFHMWLQFLCDEQLAAAQQRCLAAGMAIGVITDLAVGVHPGGADAENLAPWLAPEASVGAPPDNYNQQGQD
ncbi:MAG TPA: 4-alpha-glucanotransferase, partial [Corynebacterium sp.]|nr:4-alpha-glucanotransferase [Corynebacterium sp.]